METLVWLPPASVTTPSTPSHGAPDSSPSAAVSHKLSGRKQYKFIISWVGWVGQKISLPELVSESAGMRSLRRL